MKKETTIRVIRKIDQNDKVVHKALAITRDFKVLPYPEVDKILSAKSSKYMSSRNA